MVADQIVALVGDSLLLDAVEASLGGMPGLGVMRLHSLIADLEQRLIDIAPDVVIFELGAHELQCLLSFHKARPNVPLVGLDANCGNVVTLSSLQHFARTADDLANVIRMYTPPRRSKALGRKPGGNGQALDA